MGDVRQVSASLSTSKAPDAALGGGHATPLLNRELSPEARLLLCCARTRVGPELVAEIRTLAALPLDWEFLCGTADKHRLTQLLFRNLSAICPESIPANITTRLRHQFHANAGSNLGLGRALIGLVHTFRAEGI